MGMKYLIATLLLSSVAAVAFSQDTIYIGKKNQWLDSKEGAVHYAVKTSVGESDIKVALYTLTDTLFEVGHYSAFSANKKECIRDGQYIVYYPNGKESRITDYQNDKRHGQYRKFYKDGKLKYVSQYVNGKRDGDLIMYYNNGTVWRTEKHLSGKLQDGHVYDEKGKEVKFYPSESMPEYPGGVEGLTSDLNTRIKYPKEAAQNQIQGRVLIEIIVGKDGYISEAKLLKGVDPLLDDEAMRVVSFGLKKTRWKPGVQDGEFVRVKYIAPVNFRLP